MKSAPVRRVDTERYAYKKQAARCRKPEQCRYGFHHSFLSCPFDLDDAMNPAICISAICEREYLAQIMQRTDHCKQKLRKFGLSH